uniref:Uncharacterized protein n=1 Tax=Quercus lobata TaxID=97700 RepID=A0A7N2L2J3_QUELO
MAPRRRRNESASNDFDEHRFHNLDAQTSYHGSWEVQENQRLSATGSSTLQLSSSHVKRSNHIVCDSDDDLDRDIDEIAEVMAAESRQHKSGDAQPTLSDMMDLLQQILPCLHQILPHLNRIEKDIKEIKERQAKAH